MQTLKKLLAVLFISLLVYSCATEDKKETKDPIQTVYEDIENQEFAFQNNLRTIGFQLDDENENLFKLISYRPYIRFVKEEDQKELMVKVLFMKNNSHYISRVQYSRSKNGLHNDVNIYISGNKSEQQTNTGSKAVEILFDVNNLKEMKPFFDTKHLSYFSVTLLNEDKKNEKLGYMIVANDKNGGSVDRPPFIGQFSLQ